MDPITATAAVVSAICAIVQAVSSAQQLYARRKQRKAQEASDAGSDAQDASVPMGAFEFSVRMNYLMSTFGRHTLDDKVMRQVLRLQPRLKGVFSDLDMLKSETESERPASNVENLGRALWKRVNGLKDEIEEALAQFTKRIDAMGFDDAPIPLPAQRRLEFCYGATLCQSGKADARDLSVQGAEKTRQQWGFVCKYCFLEVADYSAVRFSHAGEPVVYSEMLVACHVTACASFDNRRAYYKCLACYENRRNVNFSSASALEKHMENHPNYSVVRSKNEAKVVETTRKNIHHYVLDPKPEIRLLSVDTTGHDAEPDTDHDTADVSPVTAASNPELTPRHLADKPVGSPIPQLALGANTTTATHPAPISVRSPTPSAPPVPNTAPPPVPFAIYPPPTEMSVAGHEYERHRVVEMPAAVRPVAELSIPVRGQSYGHPRNMTAAHTMPPHQPSVATRAHTPTSMGYTPPIQEAPSRQRRDDQWHGLSRPLPQTPSPDQRQGFHQQRRQGRN